MSEIQNVLNERQTTHGDFADHAEVTQSIKIAMQASKKWNDLTDIQKESLEMVAHKMGRICSGNPDVLDHYLDSIGYLQLAVNELRQKEGAIDVKVTKTKLTNGKWEVMP